MTLDNLIPILKKTKSPLSVRDFHHEVNVAFHDFESDSYDQIHKDMWEVLHQQFLLLVKDVQNEFLDKNELCLLDVGCGTGLGTELLLSTELGKRISKIILVDVSPKMMEKAIERSSAWGVEVVTHVGLLEEIKGDVDILLTSSVLHHIPDLDSFFATVDKKVKKGGLFIHVHDPNGDYLQNPELIARRKEIAATDQVKNLYQWLNSSEFLKSVFHRINRLRGNYNHVDLVNNHLLEKGYIKRRMTAKELWSVTDIHVEGLPFSTKKGISMQELGKKLQAFSLLTDRYYGYFGRLGFELTGSFADREQELIKQKSKEGRYLAAVWKKN